VADDDDGPKVVEPNYDLEAVKAVRTSIIAMLNSVTDQHGTNAMLDCAVNVTASVIGGTGINPDHFMAAVLHVLQHGSN